MLQMSIPLWLHYQIWHKFFLYDKIFLQYSMVEICSIVSKEMYVHACKLQVLLTACSDERKYDSIFFACCTL